MLSNIIYFLPCVVTILWVLLFALKQKNETQKLFILLMMMCIYYFTSYAFYISPWTDYDLMVKFDVLNTPLCLAILALDIVFLMRHYTSRFSRSHWHLLLYLPSVMMASVIFLVYYVVGFENAARFQKRLDELGSVPPEYDSPIFQLYNLSNVEVFRCVSITMVSLIYIACFYILWKHGYKFGNIFRFFFKRAYTTPVRAICVVNLFAILSLTPITVLGRSYMINNPEVGAFLSILIAIGVNFLAFVEYFIDIKEFRLYNLAHVNLGEGMNSPANNGPNNKLATAKDTGSSSTSQLDSLSAAERLLINKIEDAFTVQKVYRITDLSIQGLAEMVQSNRTSLSALINQYYGVPFRQLLASYRIEAAKNYMQSHPEATQEEIASECGFLTAQAFNMKFKEVVGESPRIWLSKN